MSKKKRSVLQELAEVSQKPDVSVVSGKEQGAVGTNLLGGYLDEDYEEKWRNLQTKIKLIDEIRYSDATCAGMLNAIKNPLLSAKWFIEPPTNDAKQKEIADFVTRALFTELNGGFENFQGEAFTSFDYGFSVFEKVFKVKDGMIYWDKFAPRVQSSILKWGIDGEPWVDGHPAGITQILNITDEVAERDGPKSYQPKIPWNKCIIFSWQSTGHNYEGRSIFRNGFQHWYYKQVFYKIAGISLEKTGVGTPFMKMSKGAQKKDIVAAENLLRGMRANEQNYAVFDEKVLEFGILTPNKNSSGDVLDKIISHHDKKMYDSINAGFLNLASGEGGSNALSRDQSSFFLRGLQAASSFFSNVVDQAIKELVWLNFGVQEAYPKLRSSDIGQISLDEIVTSVVASREKGLLSWSDEDEAWLRELLKMPSFAKVLANASPRIDITAQPQLPGAPTQGLSQPAVRNASFAEDYAPTAREAAFMKQIADYENFLQSQYKRAETLVNEVESDIKKGLTDIYQRADTVRRDGRLVIARTARNTQLQKDALELVRAKSGRLNRFLLKNANNKDAFFMKNLFNKTRSMAMSAVQKDESLLADLYIDDKKFNSFLKGYSSNMEGVLYNDPRRMEEDIVQNFGNQVSVDLAVKQADGVSFNRNVLKLSMLSHPRGAYNAMQYDMNADRGFNHFKVLTPKAVMKSLDPKGMTASLLFSIFTVAQLNKRINELSDGDNTDVVNGLGLHHNAITYFLPIASDQLDVEEKISAAQRKQLKQDLN